MLPKSSDFVYKNRDCLTLVVRQPLAGKNADTLYMSEQCFSKATGADNKELFLVPGATHIQTYYVPEYVTQISDKLTDFFGKNL